MEKEISLKKDFLYAIVLSFVVLFLNELIVNGTALFSARSCQNELSDKAFLIKLKQIAEKDLKVCINPKSTYSLDASAYQFGPYNVIYISKSAMTFPSIQPILMHEAGHIKNNDPSLRRWIMFLFCVLGFSLTLFLINKKKWVLFSFILIIGIPLVSKICQFIYIGQEYRADKVSADNGGKDGLVQLFKRNPDTKITWKLRFFSTHPQNSDRILHLETGKQKLNLL